MLFPLVGGVAGDYMVNENNARAISRYIARFKRREEIISVSPSDDVQLFLLMIT